MEPTGGFESEPAGATDIKGRPFGDDAIRVLQGRDEAIDPEDASIVCTATFAGGCFWLANSEIVLCWLCLEKYWLSLFVNVCLHVHDRGLELAFQRVPGVLSTSTGFMGGFADEPVRPAHVDRWHAMAVINTLVPDFGRPTRK